MHTFFSVIAALHRYAGSSAWPGAALSYFWAVSWSCLISTSTSSSAFAEASDDRLRPNTDWLPFQAPSYRTPGSCQSTFPWHVHALQPAQYRRWWFSKCHFSRRSSSCIGNAPIHCLLLGYQHIFLFFSLQSIAQRAEVRGTMGSLWAFKFADTGACPISCGQCCIFSFMDGSAFADSPRWLPFLLFLNSSFVGFFLISFL